MNGIATRIEQVEAGGITEAKLRRWLTLLNQPDRLVDDDLNLLLRFHGRLPETASQMELGKAVAALIKEKIEALRPPEGAGRTQQLPHQVLYMCFIDGTKLFQAAGKLGLSERQLSRERSRAIALLRTELQTIDSSRSYRPEPIPAIRGFLSRQGQLRSIKSALGSDHLVNVSGPPGIGKTTLVAQIATESQKTTSVLWYRFRPDVNTSLKAVLFELGDYIRSEGVPELGSYMADALPEPDVALATRLALKGLDEAPRLIVFDDYHLVENDPAISALIDELVARLPLLRMITIGRHRYVRLQGAMLEVAPFSRTETGAFLARLRVTCTNQMVKTLHAWTGGNPHLIKLAASWLKTATPEEVAKGVESLNDSAAVHDFLMTNITELLDSDDRALLEAASVFRDRFSDDALAFVAERTRGAVVDASIRLERAYVATRSLDGDTAFFHASVKDYVYDRLDPERKSELHERAGLWFKRMKEPESAEHHRKLGTPSTFHEPQPS